jgi:hypothetical protein
MGFRRLVLLELGLGIFIIVISMYFIVMMAPFQSHRQDAPWLLGHMSAYTAWGSLGIMLGIYILVSTFKDLWWFTFFPSPSSSEAQ